MPKQWKRAALEARAALADQRATIAFTAPRPGGLHQQAYTLTPGITREIVLPEAIVGSSVGALALNATLLRFEPRIPGPNTNESSGAVLARLGTDGAAWTAEMALHFPIDPAPGGHFHTWIANAIEAGKSAGYSQAKKEANPSWPLKPDEQPAALVTREGLGFILDDIRERVARGDSLEGSIEYLRPAPDGPAAGADLEVRGGYRYGNRDGQGSYRQITDSGYRILKPEPSRPLSADVATHASARTQLDLRLAETYQRVLREHDEAQGNVAALLDENARLTAKVQEDGVAITNATRAYNETLAELAHVKSVNARLAADLSTALSGQREQS